MLADPELAAFDAHGTTEGTPYLLLLRRGGDGTLAARAQVGHVPDAGKIVAEIEAALASVIYPGSAPGSAPAGSRSS